MRRHHARSIRSFIAAALVLAWVAPTLTPASAPTSSSIALAGASEKELLDAFQSGFASSDPAARAAAVTTLGDSSRSLPDEGASKKVAQALVKGLEDRELEVCQASVFQLAHGRDVDTVVGALDPFLREQHRQIANRVESTDSQSRNHVDRATVVFANACHVLANYEDDRAAATLVPLLLALKPDTKKNDLGSRLAGVLATSALDLATASAVEAAVKQTKTFSGPAQLAGLRKLHDALAEFATRNGMTPPEWSDSCAEAWQAWLAANRNKLPKTLGRLATPPGEGKRPLNGLPGKNA